jgi:hypothetical protein
MLDFTNILIGKEYDRPELARLWGYKSFNAISRGVFSPKNKNILVFFITKDKQETLTQYQDHIDEDILFWEGEIKHGSDNRIISKKDTIHIFYRERHHSDFIYEGRASLKNCLIFTDKPSKFVFDLIDRQITFNNFVAELRSDYSISITEKRAILKSRIGQGIYRNRAIDLWKTCSVTGFTEPNVLIASHIKPWKVSTNNERLNPYNSLLLVPTLDKLFDNGYIGFEPSGKIMLSEKINDEDWARIEVNTKLKLRSVPDETKKFLEYHSEYIFELGNVSMY